MSFNSNLVKKIPESWDIKKLKEKVEIVMGQSPKSEFYNKNGEGMPFMQGRTTFGEKYHTIDTWCTDPKRLAEKNTVLMSVRAPVGDVNIAKMDLCIGRGLASLNMKNENNQFLYYLLKNYINVILSKESGTVFGSINKTELENIELPFPQDNEQKVMSNILLTLDEKVEINNQINKKLEEIAQVIFKRWFVDFEFPDENGNPYKSSGGEMVGSEMGMIPKGWSIKELGTLIQVCSGKRPKEKSGLIDINFKIPLIGASSIMGYTKEENFNDQVLVIGRVGTLGVVQRFNTSIWASDNTLVIKTPYSEFVNQILNKIDYTSLNRGSTQPLITQGDIKKEKIVLPQETIINKFEKRVESFFKERKTYEKENNILAKIRDILLPKLMSGEIRVTLDK